MPYLKVQVNQEIKDESKVLKNLSKLVADKLGKPESYVMVALEPKVKMSFAGNLEPSVFMELKSIGLQNSETKELSQALCAFIEKELGVKSNRVYIEFANSPGQMWGWNGGTF